MPETNISFPTATASPSAKRPFYKRPWAMLGLGVSLGVVAIACVLLWGARHYQGLVELGRQTSQRYAVAEAAHPFEKPQPGQGIPSQRWKRMLGVRTRVQAKITPAMDRMAEDLIGAKTPGRLGLATSLMALADDLQALADEHLAALDEAGMGAKEYSWLLALAINESLKESADSEAGGGYRDILGGIQKLTHATGDTHDDVSAEELIRKIGKSFVGYQLDKPWVLDELKAQSRSAYMLDLLALALGDQAGENR